MRVSDFAKLHRQLAENYDARNRQRLARADREREIGGGGKFQHSLADRLLMLLIYYRTYVSQEFLSVLFDCNQSTIARNINMLLPMLNGIFKVPERRIKIESKEIKELFYDATEQAVNRPRKGQRKYYSGKKKRHTIKHQTVVSSRVAADGKRKYKIEAVSRAFIGKTHDKKIYDKAKTHPPPQVEKIGDSAYLGTTMTTPHKNTKNHKLSKKQKQENRQLSKKRVFVEHAIGKMKIYKIAASRFRNPRKNHTAIYKCLAGLTNLSYA